MTLTNWIAVVAIIVTLVVGGAGAAIAWRSSQLTYKKTTKSGPEWRLYLVDSFCLKLPNEDQLFAFIVSIANLSELQGSVSSGEFLLDYLVGGKKTTAKFRHRPELVKASGTKPALVFQLPLDFSPRQEKVGILLFSVPKEIWTAKEVTSHKIQLSDAYGPMAVVEPILIMEIHDTSYLENRRALGISV
jgi:hypothetical protein